MVALRVELFLTQLLDLWRKITTNDEKQPHSYFVYMMQKWPAEPVTAPAVLLRTWLAEKMYNKDPKVAT